MDGFFIEIISINNVDLNEKYQMSQMVNYLLISFKCFKLFENLIYFDLKQFKSFKIDFSKKPFVWFKLV